MLPGYKYFNPWVENSYRLNWGGVPWDKLTRLKRAAALPLSLKQRDN